MAKWHRAEEAAKSWLRYADEDAKKKGEEEKGGGSGIGGRGGAAVLIPLSMKEEKNWQIV